ncbi:DivIVA domain-containing protein [Nocardia jiangxiensis]|uniref:DivIVA domain-containing protein n=1 Tax=Nocardia jiangxiensis TaxID=282685 RepID=A0ABW6RQK9_9NOCA
MLTMLLYVLIVGLVAALLFLVASAVFGRAEELGPLPEGTTETVLPAHDISGADVRDLRFQQVFRGYKAGEVDWALARLAARIDELEAQLAQAHGESPQRPESGEPTEQTGPGAWTGAHRATGTPQPHGESRIERPGNGSTEQSGETPNDTPGRNDGMQSSLAGLTIGYPPAAPGHATGQIPWHDPAETGPWEPPAVGNGTGPLPTAPPQAGGPIVATPASGAIPAVAPGIPQPGSPFTAPPGVTPGGPPQPSVPFLATPPPGTAGPDGYPVAPGAYTGGQPVLDQSAGFPPPTAQATGSLSLPPVAQSPHNQPVPWPGRPGQTTPEQL